MNYSVPNFYLPVQIVLSRLVGGYHPLQPGCGPITEQYLHPAQFDPGERERGWHVPLKCWYTLTRLYGVTTRKTTVWPVPPLKTSDLRYYVFYSYSETWIRVSVFVFVRAQSVVSGYGLDDRKSIASRGTALFLWYHVQTAYRRTAFLPIGADGKPSEREADC
jgi:hypothetical protein